MQAVGVTSLLPVAGQDVRATFTPEGYVPPKGAGLNLAWASAGDGRLLPRRGHSHHSRPRLYRGRRRRERSAGGHRQPHPGRALLAGTGPHRQTPSPRAGGGDDHALDDCRGRDRRRESRLAADAPTQNQFYSAFSQVKADAGLVCAARHADRQRRLHRAAQPCCRRSKWLDALRAVVRSIDPQLPLTQVESMEHVVERRPGSRRFNTALISSFAAAAVLLALLGIYSVIAFSAALRTQEMAIRLALGSQRSSVMRLVLVSGAKLGLLGCGIGAIAAVFATRLLRSLLFAGRSARSGCYRAGSNFNFSARACGFHNSRLSSRSH